MPLDLKDEGRQATSIGHAALASFQLVFGCGIASPSTRVAMAASSGADPTFSGTRSPSIASRVMP